MLIASLTLPAVVGAEQVLIPAGSFDAPEGAMMGEGPWVLDAEGGAALAAKLHERGRDLPVDFEHQTLLASKNGQPAPAAGWIAAADIVWREGVGLVATAIRWTERAAAWIGEGAYRFLSPVFRYTESGAVMDLLHVALTNNPALPNLPEVRLAAASFMSQEASNSMNDLRERVLYLLDLPITTTDEDLIGELDKLKALVTGAEGTAATTGLVAGINSRNERIAALTAELAAAPPVAALNALQAEIAALRQAEAERERSSLIEPALLDGRIPVALKEWAGGLELAALKTYLDGAKPIAALTGTQTQGRAPGGDPAAPNGFTAALKAEFGDEATYLAYKRANDAGRVKFLNFPQANEG